MTGGMVLNLYQFEVLRASTRPKKPTQREVAVNAGISLGSVNKAFREMREAGCIDANGAITKKGLAALAPYKVENAVILAAGMATRFAPLSFEQPKAMFEVRGEVLIERVIRQLKEAGINDIVVVVGYMKERFFYLEDQFGVRIVVNPEYAVRNNHSSIRCVAGMLGNTYIISSDQYYTRNIFEPYCYCACCSASFSEGPTTEQTLLLDDKNTVLGLEQGGSDAYYMQGPAFFDREFSRTYLEILGREYARPETFGKLWEQIFAEHVDELHMVMKSFEPGTIYEFDYLTDLTAFDGDFFANVDSRILDNICRTLACAREDITEVVPVKAGLTNLSTLFTAKGAKYIYRHPGNGTDAVVNRAAETYALEVARKLGLDDTYIYEDPKDGWKISHYVEGCTEFDYGDREQVRRALQLVKRLHESGETSPWSFDFFAEGCKIATTLRAMSYPTPRDFDSLQVRARAVSEAMAAECEAPVFCHNDFYGPNILVRGDEMRLIDWEYAAMGDAVCDIGNFVAQGSGYTVADTLEMLPLYYGRPATGSEARRCVAAVGVVGWYWYVWAMYKEAMGNPVGEWLYTWYRAARTYLAAAEELYGRA